VAAASAFLAVVLSSSSWAALLAVVPWVVLALLVLALSEIVPPRLPREWWSWTYMASHSIWHVLVFTIAYLLLLQ